MRKEASRGNPARFFVTAKPGMRESDRLHFSNEMPVPGV
jgi:hypothetical protein